MHITTSGRDDGGTAPARAVQDAHRVPRTAPVVVCSWRDAWHPEGGGAEHFLRRIGEDLARTGCDVTVLTARYPGSAAEERSGGLTYLRAGGKLGVYARSWWRLARMRLPREAVVVDVQNGLPFFTRLATRARVVVLVHHVHREQWPIVYGPLASRLGWFLESRVATVLYRGCQYVTVSDVSREELAGLGVDRRRISVVHNGVDDASSTASRSDTPRVCVLGRLVPHKQVEHVVDAVAHLRTELPGLHLDVIGDGWWREELEQHVRRRGANEAVTFHGHVTEVRKDELLAGAWVNAVPSVKEGWGLTVVEAARHAVPTVAYRGAGGVAESVVDGVTGLLAEDRDDFAGQLRRLLLDAGERERLGTAARSRALTFSWSSSAESFRKVLDVVQRGGTAAWTDPAEAPGAHDLADRAEGQRLP